MEENKTVSIIERVIRASIDKNKEDPKDNALGRFSLVIPFSKRQIITDISDPEIVKALNDCLDSGQFLISELTESVLMCWNKSPEESISKTNRLLQKDIQSGLCAS